MHGQAGDLYRFRLDDDDNAFRIRRRASSHRVPTERQISSDSLRFYWGEGWRGVTLAGQVIYEVHVGTYTREGTFEV